MFKTVAVALTALLISSAAYSQCDDNYDANLCVYPLSIADGATFRVDGQASAFWSTHTGDMIVMDNANNCFPGRCMFTGLDDAAIDVKAFATARGLYVLSTVTDNTWVDKAAADDWGADAIDFYFDANSANTIFTCTDCLIGLYASTLSYQTQQFQVWMGASQPPTGCQYQYYDENLWSWQILGMNWAALKTLYGIEIDIITIDATHKAQEWFFPWEKFGNGIPVGTLLDGKFFGFSGGYNDKDGDNANPDCLRWLLKDPWAEDAKTVNYWGDFVIQAGVGNSINDVIPQAVKTSVSARVAQKSARNEYYTLQGKRTTQPTPNKVLVQRYSGTKHIIW